MLSYVITIWHETEKQNTYVGGTLETRARGLGALGLDPTPYMYGSGAGSFVYRGLVWLGDICVGLGLVG